LLSHQIDALDPLSATEPGSLREGWGFGEIDVEGSIETLRARVEALEFRLNDYVESLYREQVGV
jgi:hypothetical protein